MKIVVFAASKGGVGKTTLATAMAVAASVDADPRATAVMELDPQGSLTAWWNWRGSGDDPAFVAAQRLPLPDVIAALRGVGYELLILDCPPGFAQVLRAAVAAADLVVIATGPGELDLAAIGSTVAVADEQRIPYVLVLNKALFRTRLAGRAVARLREMGGLVGPVVHHRVQIAEATGEGRTVLELAPASVAAREVTALWHLLRGQLWDSARPRSLNVGDPT
jgi:chromosome partitioning protein